MSSITAGKGSIVRFQQNHNGLPIIGGQLVVSQDAKGALIAIDGKASTDLPASTTAAVSAATAAATAKQATANATPTKDKASQLTASTPTLSIYDPALFGRSGGLASRPVYQVTVTSAKDPSVDEYVLVDADTGSIALAFSQSDANYRPTAARAAKPATAVKPATAPDDDIEPFTNPATICDFQDVPNTNVTCTDQSQDRPGHEPIYDPTHSTVPDVINAYNYMGAVAKFYHDVLGLDPLLNGNSDLASVRYCYDADDCPYVGAYWDGSEIVFGDGFPSAPDLVGSEFTHAATDWPMQYYQSGAISESVSDVIGELFDQYNGTDTNGQWIMGENLPAGWQVDIANPPASAQGAQPDSMSSSYWNNDAFDNGGIHINSGVGNKLAYLAAEGTQGTPFNGVTVAGIANDGAADPNMIQKMANIWFTADLLLTPLAGYADFGNALQTACTTLLASATDGIIAADCASVTAAVSATQLESTTSTHLPTQSPNCSTGYTPAIAFSDNFDRTSSTSLGSNWTNSGPAEIDWFSYNAIATGNQLYIPAPVGENGTVTNTYVYTKPIALSKAHGSYLYFQHLDSLDWYDGKDTGQPANYYMEGMWVEYQLGTSTAWGQVSGTWVNGPNKTVVQSYINGSTLEIGPSYSGVAFGGDSQSWTSSRVTLPTTWEGQTVKFRFRLQSDGYDWPTSSYGEFLDNVSVNTCVKAPLAPTTPKAAGYHGSAKVTWGTAGANGGSAISGYEMSVLDTTDNTTDVYTTTAATARSFTFTALSNAHNYTFRIRAKDTDGAYGPYATVSLVGTSILATSNVTKVAKGGSVTLSGKLSRTTAGTPLSGATLVVYQRKHGTTAWATTTITGKTTTTGTYSIVVKPTQSEDYFVSYSTGSATYMGTASVTLSITV